MGLRLGAAAAGGVALWSAFPTVDAWWLAPVGVGLLAGASLTAGAGRGFGVGLVGGLSFFVPTLSWSGTYVGKVPWFALAILQALYVASMCAVIGLVGRRLVRAGRPALALAVVPVAWVLQEWARGSTPYGGFPWARLAFSQADSPLLHLARWAGATGMTFAVAVVGTGLLALGLGVVRRSRALGILGVVLAGAPWSAGVLPLPMDGRTAAVGFVQGNVPAAGLDFNAERRAVLDNHVRGTEALMDRAPDDLTVVVWPENAADIDPLRNADAAAQVERARTAAGVPLVVGAVLSEPPGRSSNTSLFYDGRAADPQRYTKLHPVPFAEYIPHREFFRVFTSAADLAGNFVAGDTVGAFSVPAPSGAYTLLPTICFEVAYDTLMRDSVAAAGASDSLLLVQTNNATFGYTAESEQQFAISRVRAVEHGRSVVHVSTVGVSGFIAPDGSVTGATGLFTAEQGIGRPVLRSERAPSDRIGGLPEIAALVVLVVLVSGSLRGGRTVKVSTRPTRRPRTDEQRP
ncbi:MAG: apolipoprotein N-acyltransferase [Dermatophilaceae bacterium]